MEKTIRLQRIVIAVLLIAVALMAIVLGAPYLASTPAIAALQATATPAPTATVPPGEVIPVKPLTDLKSLNATVRIDANGLLDGQRKAGTLNAVVATNDQGQSKASVTGDLLGDIVAQVGGSAVKLFAPSQVDIYKMPDGTYIVVKGFFDVCIKTKPSADSSAVDQLSPDTLLNMLTSGDVARGKFVGDTTVNGRAAKQYLINGDAFLAAAQKSTNPALNTFGKALWSAEDADLFLDAQGGYPIAFRGNYSGMFEPLKFEGDFGMQLTLDSVNQNTPIALPSACNNPIQQ